MFLIRDEMAIFQVTHEQFKTVTSLNHKKINLKRKSTIVEYL